MLIALTIFLISCAFATIVAVAASILSSRVNRSQPIMEQYETVLASQNSSEFTRHTYPVKTMHQCGDINIVASDRDSSGGRSVKTIYRPL